MCQFTSLLTEHFDLSLYCKNGFRDANSFSGAKLEESCELRGTDYFQGQKYEHIFQRKMEATVTTNSLPCTVCRMECCVLGQSRASKNN